MIIDTVNIWCITNVVRSRLHICDRLIFTFGIRGLCLEFSNASHGGSLDRFRKSVVDKVKFYTSIKNKNI